MPRTGELSYYERIGEAGLQHALSKPFSDDDGLSLQRVGALLSLLPPPPARVLECGCGTGRFAYFPARLPGLATDVAPEAIRLAREYPVFREGPTPEFLVADTEALGFAAAFDGVIFFDSLTTPWTSWRPCAAPGWRCGPAGSVWPWNRAAGTTGSRRELEASHDVTARDMPPWYIRRLGRRVGFSRCRLGILPLRRWSCGITILYKDPAEKPVRPKGPA